MFVFRLNKIKINDNRERRRFFGLFGKDRAEVKVLSFVTTETTDLPNLDGLMKATTPEKQQQILQQMVSTVINRRILTTVENVRDGQTMTFGDTGFAVYVSNDIPQKFDWLLAVIESDSDLREQAQWASDVLKSPKFGDFSNELLGLLKNTAKGAAALSNPVTLVSMAIGRFAVDVLLERGKKDKDDQLGLLYMSLIRPQHYPFGKRDVQDVADLTGNMQVDYSLFGVDEVQVVVPPPAEPKPKKDKEKKADKKPKEGKKKDKPAVG